MKLIASSAFTLLLVLQAAHGETANQAATVTLYRTGRSSVGIHTDIDGVKIASLGDHKQVTFRVVPGYHEISAKWGSLTPIRFFNAEPGQHLYFALDYEHSRLPTSSNGLSLTLDQVSSVLDLTTKQQNLTDNELAEILSAANPTGAEPKQLATLTIPTRTLTEEEVQQAIFQGMHDRTSDAIGFTLNDVQTSALSPIVVDGGVSGYSITVFSAPAWIEWQAAEAHRLMKPFTAADVTPDMREDVVRVVASPSTPGKLHAEGISAASEAEHVVIADESKKTVVQPLEEEAGSLEVDSALRSAEFGAVSATFNINDIRRVQNKDGEFLIAVTGGYRKFFKVKKGTPIWAMLRQRG